MEEDSLSVCMSFTSGSIGGEFKHQMLIDELVSHDHVMTKNRNWGNSDYGGSAAPAWSREVISADNLTSKTGNSKAFNVIQPYVVIYRWRRVS